jgi:hypothetical protein
MWFLIGCILVALLSVCVSNRLETRALLRGLPPRRTDAERAQDKDRGHQDRIEQARVAAANAAGAKAYRERWGSLPSRLP